MKFPTLVIKKRQELVIDQTHHTTATGWLHHHQQDALHSGGHEKNVTILEYDYRLSNIKACSLRAKAPAREKNAMI
jgi:hypothetical protein